MPKNVPFEDQPASEWVGNVPNIYFGPHPPPKKSPTAPVGKGKYPPGTILLADPPILVLPDGNWLRISGPDDPAIGKYFPGGFTGSRLAPWTRAGSFTNPPGPDNANPVSQIPFIPTTTNPPWSITTDPSSPNQPVNRPVYSGIPDTNGLPVKNITYEDVMRHLPNQDLRAPDDIEDFPGYNMAGTKSPRNRRDAHLISRGIGSLGRGIWKGLKTLF